MLDNWPPSPANTTVINKQGCVAVCTGATDHTLLELKHSQIAIAGSCITVNPGLLRLVETIVANPYIRFIIFCGERSSFKPDVVLQQWLQDTPQLPIPTTQKLTEQLRRLREQVHMINLTLDEHKPTPHKILENLLSRIQDCAMKNPGRISQEPIPIESPPQVTIIDANENPELVWDPLGHFVVKIVEKYIVVEHYKASTCELDCVIRGKTAKEVLHTVIAHKLFGDFTQREQHIAYLGREVGKAEMAMLNGFKYVQSEQLVVKEKGNDAKNDESCGVCE
ncbi:MAG: DUF4346 domain-containing protein [Nanoarchaeota archaeon]